ncbi:MAG: hypothetical protein AAFO62_07680 [Pseudomonadota bacterium]
MAQDTAGRTEPMGYAIGYARGKGTFRVYILGVGALIFLTVAVSSGSQLALILGSAGLVAAFFFYPLIETGKARIGANQYGVFIEGFGLIAWRGIAGLRIAKRAIRNITVHELEITLSRTMDGAVMADWRNLPYHRLLMRLPWRMPSDDKLLIDLEPFGLEPKTILNEIQRRWSYFGRG